MPEYLPDEVPIQPKKKHRAMRPVTPESESLSASDRQALGRRFQGKDMWLPDMETYCTCEMKKSSVHKIFAVSCAKWKNYPQARWGAGVSFAKGKLVDLSTDCPALHLRACDFKDEHGRDLGNGWLLRHPITKIHKFQLYLMEKKEEEQTK